jgi:hypothetical protein
MPWNGNCPEEVSITIVSWLSNCRKYVWKSSDGFSSKASIDDWQASLPKESTSPETSAGFL